MKFNFLVEKKETTQRFKRTSTWINVYIYETVSFAFSLSPSLSLSCVHFQESWCFPISLFDCLSHERTLSKRIVVWFNVYMLFFPFEHEVFVVKINLVFCSLAHSISSFSLISFFFLSISILPDRRTTSTNNALHVRFARSFVRSAARRTQNFYTWIKINCISRQWTLASVTLLIIPIHRRVVVKWKKERALKKVNKKQFLFFVNFFFYLRAASECIQFTIKCEKLIRISLSLSLFLFPPIMRWWWFDSMKHL